LNRGYVKVWRKIEDSGLIQLPNTLALFMHLLLRATHKDTKRGTTTGVIELKRGQYISGIHKLSETLEQSERQIRTSIDRLVKLGIITVKATNKYSIYTIENYSKYQDNDTQSDNQTTNKRQSNDKETTTKQECKNLRIKEKNIRGSRLPNDWIAPQQFIDFCNSERQDLNANLIAEQFKDYWISVAGSKGVKADWFATWRNWVRRQDASKSSFKNKSAVVSDQQFDDWLNTENPKVRAING
jgi:biotin operon repressor